MVEPLTKTPLVSAWVKPLAEVIMVKEAPPFVEILSQPAGAAYTFVPLAKTPHIILPPSPSAVVLLVKETPPFVEILSPPHVAA